MSTDENEIEVPHVPDRDEIIEMVKAALPQMPDKFKKEELAARVLEAHPVLDTDIDRPRLARCVADVIRRKKRHEAYLAIQNERRLCLSAAVDKSLSGETLELVEAVELSLAVIRNVVDETTDLRLLIHIGKSNFEQIVTTMPFQFLAFARDVMDAHMANAGISLPVPASDREWSEDEKEKYRRWIIDGKGYSPQMELEFWMRPLK